MQVRCFADRESMDRAAAEHAAASLRAAIAATGAARVVAATAASQLGFLDRLSRQEVPWNRVELFHLDEYVGLPASHPASFRRMLREHLIDKTGISVYHLLDGDGDADDVRRRVGGELTRKPVDVAFIGIGENAHLAFNDPPADFETAEPYLELELDEACRRQQVGEGWFPTLDDVPRRAISMSVRQILLAREILVIVPDRRKAAAVRATLEERSNPLVPASILHTHERVTLYLDAPAASELPGDLRARYQL